MSTRSTSYENVRLAVEQYVRDNNLPGYPLYYEESAKFLVNGQPSGLRGAEARVTFTLANQPHLIFGVVTSNTYELTDEVYPFFPTYYADMRQGGIDDQQTISISLTQQNVTAQPVSQDRFSGAAGTVWRPWPAIYFFRGSNQASITARRLVSYPAVPLGGDTVFRPEPELRATLVCVQLNSDLVANRNPGSTGRP